MATNEIIISRDVQFHESVFPFSNTTHANNNTTTTEVEEPLLPAVPCSTANVKSGRVIKKPSWLQDYVVQASTVGEAHTAFLGKSQIHKELYSYAEASKNPT